MRYWQGTSASVPALLRPFVSKNSLSWMDHATWVLDEYKIDWRTETNHSKYSSCSGVNYFQPDPDNPKTRTRCVIAGEFVVYGDKIPAMPTFIGLKIAPKLESIILGFMLPNFRQLAAGIGATLDAKKQAAAGAGDVAARSTRPARSSRGWYASRLRRPGRRHRRRHGTGRRVRPGLGRHRRWALVRLGARDARRCAARRAELSAVLHARRRDRQCAVGAPDLFGVGFAALFGFAVGLVAGRVRRLPDGLGHGRVRRRHRWPGGRSIARRARRLVCRCAAGDGGSSSLGGVSLRAVPEMIGVTPVGGAWYDVVSPSAAGAIVSGTTFGRMFRVTTFGESHGPGLGAIIDGCPPGLALDVSDLQGDLDRRRPGRNRLMSARNEADAVEILSGVADGLTTGTPIALLIRNTDQRPKAYDEMATLFRPSHADYTYQAKYGHRARSGGGRASARRRRPAWPPGPSRASS